MAEMMIGSAEARDTRQRSNERQIPDNDENMSQEKDTKVSGCAKSCGDLRGAITQLYEHPKSGKAARALSVILSLLLLWGLLLCLAGSDAAPGGQLFNMGILFVVAQILGLVAGMVHLPPLLGMLIAGIILRNVGVVHLSGSYSKLAETLRKMALSIILLRAGLGLDPSTLKRLSVMVLRLAALPSFVEAIAITISTHFLLGMPWLWGALLGSVLAAVSPAVVIPCLFRLQAEGYGCDKGIPTLVIAAASFDDIIAVSAFGILLNVLFSTDDLIMKIIQGPVGIAIGMAFGILWGLVVRYIPRESDSYAVPLRSILIGFGVLLCVLGSEAIGYDGAGPLGCIVAAFVASYGWRKQGWNEENNPVAEIFRVIWVFFQPILFGLIGSEIDLFVLELYTVGMGIAALAIALTCRILISIFIAYGGNLNIKEKLFVSFAWFPKATVQAALGPVALDLVRKMEDSEEKNELLGYANNVLIVAVLAILLTAPMGAILITILGPRLLTKKTEQKTTENPNPPSFEEISHIS